MATKAELAAFAAAWDAAAESNKVFAIAWDIKAVLAVAPIDLADVEKVPIEGDEDLPNHRWMEYHCGQHTFILEEDGHFYLDDARVSTPETLRQLVALLSHPDIVALMK